MKKYGKFALINLILIFLDQITKYLAITHLKGTEGIPLIQGIFRLQYLENTGAAFGILSNGLPVLLASTIIISGLLVYAYHRLPASKKYVPMEYILIFLCAGAAGNFIDRAVNGFVIDFLYFELINFPIFNVADCYVTVSAVLLLLLGIFYYKEEDFEFLFRKKGKVHE